MMKGSDTGEHEKKAKLFNEWEKFTSTDGESIESYYHRFMQLMNDLKRNKHFPEKHCIESQMNLDEVNELRSERLAKSHDPLALMAHSQNSYNFPTTYKDQSSSSTHSQQSFPINNKYNPQPSLNKNFMQPPMTSLEDINDSTKAMNAALILFAKAFLLTTPTNNNQRTSSNPRNFAQNVVQNAGVQNGGNQNGLVVVQRMANQNGTGNVIAVRAEGTRNGNQARCYNCRGLGHITRNRTARPRRRDDAYLQTQLLISQKEEAGIQLQAEEFDFMATAGDLDEIEEVNANCILMVNLQHASTSGTQLDNAPVYDTNGSAEVQLNDNCYDNEKFNTFTQEEHYTDLLEPIPKPQLVPQNDNHVTSVAPSIVQSGGTVETSSAPNEETQKSSISSLMEEKKRLKHDFKTQEDKFLDKEVDLEAKIKDFENIPLKRDQTVQTMHMLNPKPDSFYHPNQKMALGMSVTPHVDKPKLSAVTPHSKKLHASILSHSVPQPREFNVMKHRNVIALKMFKINPYQTPRVDLVPNKQSSVSIRTNSITNSQRHVIVKENMSSNTVTASSIGLVHAAITRRPQPKGNTKNARVPSASKSSKVKKNVTVEDHRRTLLLSKNQKTMSSECNNIKLAIRNDKSEIVCDTTNKKKVFEFNCVSWQKFLGIVRFRNDHIAAILGYGDLNWGNITIARVYFVEGLGHNLFLVGQFCDADLEVAFRRNTCFIRDLDGVELFKGNHSINLYTINLYDMALASSICLMARATPTKSWLWHQRLSHLNFDTINDLAKNDLVFGLPKFKYAKEHLCPSCEKGKIKKASHTPKPVLNFKQRLHLLHMNLCGPMRAASINGKRYVLVIVDDYSRYTWVYFLITKDETPEVIKNFLTKIYVRLQAPIIIVSPDNRTEFKNHVLKEYFDSVGITHETSAAKTPQQNRVIERRNRMLVEAARTMLIFSHALLCLWAEAIATAYISYLYVFGALCYPKNDHEDISKLGVKGDIRFFIGYSANSIAYRVYNWRTKKIIETMNITFDELSAMTFEQNSSRLGLQSMTSGRISSKLELTYAPSTITPQRPSERDLYILFEPLHNEYLGGQPLEAPSAIHAALVIQNLQAPTASIIMEPKTIKETLTDPAWIKSMQEKLHQFIRLDVWELVPSSDGIKPLTLKWLFKNKHDEENMIIRNKTRLVWGDIDKRKVSLMPIIQDMSTSHVYKLKKALYGLKQVPRAWYNELSTFLLQNRFSKGTIDPMLFTRRFDDNILVAQVNQSPSGIFINQSNYENEILKKYRLNTCDIVGTLMDIKDKLDLDQIGTPVDATKYRSMIGAFM
uniref:Integrase catalytic domain-containing protein n=1 Tax=Tanacetum cinerariifolium TaxID=118510 RepID=A0A6L2KUT4_TANCI|nr:hypothetical protein [Tanacetum cinerariifolium]